MRSVTKLSMSVVAVAALLSGCKPSTTPVSAPAPAAGPSQPGPMSGADAQKMLATLVIKGSAPMSGYSRDQFGQAWTDDNDAPGGHNKCDTRDDILRRDLSDIQPVTGCQVQSGTLHDAYTGKTIAFARGPKSTVVQIDHMVPLGDAWQSGAQQLPPDKRIDLANDPRNLQAVDGPTNESKGDSDAATWLPPQAGYRCTYVERQIQVKSIYGLWVTQAEHDAMAGVLQGC
ncbi:HNH endonuclease family protein [Nocardia sp. BMG111209]|uniref:HNH endonuclease family protein n=1 Tax=Nocardia sp. BMG111209 TaxID=1160137 RepID=UPI0003A61564